MTQRLLARRRVDPTWLSHPFWRDGTLTVETYGPEVAELCALADFAPDPEQELILDLLFAIGPDGKSAVYEADIIGPRQNFKTGLIKQAEIGWLFVTEERLVVHSAHELSTTEEAFNDLRALIENTPALSRRLDVNKGKNPGISEGNGRWAIHLLDEDGRPQRIKYKARTKGGGRGLTGNKVVLDEGFALQPSHMGSLEPTLAAVPDPQLLTASSAGLLASDVLRDKRDRGRAGKSPRQMYVEYGDREAWSGCAEPDCVHAKDAVGCVLDDESRWEMIQPALDRRVHRETIRSMRQSMPIEEFLREFMVWWEDPPLLVADQIFGEHWGACAVPHGPRPRPSAIGVAVAVNRDWASIGAAANLGSQRFVGAVDRRRGTAWLMAEAVRIAREQDCPIVLDEFGPAADLIDGFRTQGVPLLVTNTTQMKDACAALFDAVTESHGVAHMHDTELDAAVAGAVKRNVGDRFMWGRRPSMSDVSMLEAVTLADWGSRRATPPPARPQSARGARSATADLASANF